MAKKAKKTVVKNITDKVQKLESLMNKVVEFNKPDIFYCKGFLYRDSEGYYIKVVETIIGSLSINTKLYLVTGDEAYIVQAEKPKLMRVSMKSWHYRLVKYVLGNNAPTPKTMQNGCPYFWLLIFSIIVSPFKYTVSLFVELILLFPNLLLKALESSIDNWIVNIEDEQIYGYYYSYNKYGNNYLKIPAKAKYYFDKTDENIIDYFLNEKYGLTCKDSEAYKAKKSELAEKWNAWRNEMTLKEDELYRKKLDEAAERLRKQAIQKAKWDARIKPLENIFNKIIDSLIKMFSFNMDWKNIIRKTKQFVGGIITLIILVFTFLFINAIAYVLTTVIDWSISNWEYYAITLILLSVIGIVYLLYFFIISWGQNIVNKYKNGKKVWYIEPLIWLFYPVKYIALAIGYSIFYCALVPIIWIAKNIIKPSSLFIWRGLCAIGRGIAGSTGIFGEYFNASYTDYCPGLEWADTDEE